jgi:hypothetical protein
MKIFSSLKKDEGYCCGFNYIWVPYVRFNVSASCHEHSCALTRVTSSHHKDILGKVNVWLIDVERWTITAYYLSRPIILSS